MRGEIQKALVRLGEVQPATFPTWLLPGIQAQELPTSLAAPRVGHQVQLPLILTPPAPGLQGHRPALLLQPASCLGAPCSGGSAGCPALAGRQLAWLGREAGALAPGLPCAGIPARWAGRRQAPCVATSLGNLGTWDLWENILFLEENVHGQVNQVESRSVIFQCAAGSVPFSMRTPVACRRSASLCEFSDSALGLAHKCKTVRGLCHHSLARCRVSLTSSAEKSYSISAISAALNCGK